MSTLEVVAAMFQKYVTKFRVEKGQPFTHTSIGKPRCSYYVPVESETEFYEAYQQAYAAKEPLHMTEKHRDVSPILIDLDFRHKPPELHRRYTIEHVKHVLRHYYAVLADYVNLELLDTRAFVLEKPSPRLEKGKVKDGVHIIMPGIVTRPATQLFIRTQVLTRLTDVFNEIGIENTSDDCFDEAVIQRNNWQMYGSSKPDCTTYAATHVFRYSVTDHVEDVGPFEGDDLELTQLLSIRNKYDEAEFVSEEKRQQIEDQRPTKPTTIITNVVRNHSPGDVQLAQQLVTLLSPARADTYDAWMRVGWCLRNIDYHLLDKWVEFSRSSPKFIAGDCEDRWDKMKVNGGLGIATLKMWAATDNPDRYRDIIREDTFNLIHRANNGSHYDVACVVHAMFNNMYVCASVKNHFWYEYKNHKWHPCEDGMTLSQRMSVQVCQEFLHVASIFNQRAANTDDDTQQKQYVDLSQRLNKVALSLKNTQYKKNVMQECAALFYVAKFEERLDAKPHLIGFNNGVYDLETLAFREGQPDDCITFATGIDYIPLDVESAPYHQLCDYFSKVFVNENVRDYVLTHLSSCLNGQVREERFHIWTGSGSNSKSICVSLFEKCFGDYCCKLPVALLTNKRAASNAASSEIARTKGRRFAVLQEPSENERFNVGIMKELSGGDKIMARSLYREPFEFQPMFKMILTCNHLPEVPATDEGTWRRIRVVEFKSKFTDRPDPTKSNHFPIDGDLPNKMETWKETFMSMLIERYKRYRANGLSEPQEVLQCTMEYQKNNDFIQDFVESCTSALENNFVSTNEVYAVFKTWAHENNPDSRTQGRKEFVLLMRRIWGVEQRGRGGMQGWYGYRVAYDPYGDGDEGDDEV